MGDCRYRLTEQPFNTMTCNPYPSGKFFTRCVVQFSTTEGGPLRLAWYSRAQLGGTPQRIFSGFVTKNTISSIESELTVQIKDIVSFCDGFSAYYCQVSFYNGTLLSRSQEIYLFPQYVFSNALKMCDEQRIQSSHIAKCVDPQFSTAEQATTLPSISMTTAPFTTTQQTMNPISEVTTPPPTSMSPLEGTTPPVTTKTFSATTEYSPSTKESSPSTENLPSTTTTTETLPPEIISSQSMTTSSNALLTTKPSSLTSESHPVTTPLPLVTENHPQTTNNSLSTTEASPSSLLAPESSQTTTESLSPTTKASPLISTAPDSLPSSQSDSQGASTAPQSPQQPQPQATSPPTDRDPTSNSGPSTESEIGSGRFDDEALLFLTLGAAVFLLILIGCIVFCLCLWSDQCRQCSYEICCSDECCCMCSCCLCLDDI